jgi:hypothetical protein
MIKFYWNCTKNNKHKHIKFNWQVKKMFHSFINVLSLKIALINILKHNQNIVKLKTLLNGLKVSSKIQTLYTNFNYKIKIKHNWLF